MMRGRVKWFSVRSGFGLIEREGGPDVSCHASSIRTEGFKMLSEGQEVEFELDGADATPRAAYVLPLGN